MKILHVISRLTVGGAQRLVSSLLPQLNTTDEVTLLVYNFVDTPFEREVLKAGVKIISMNSPNLRDPKVVLKMRKVFKNYDIVHVHLFPTVYWASLAARGLSVKMVYTEHSTSNRRRSKWYFRFIDKFFYARYDAIVSISEQTQNNLIAWLQYKNKKFITINNGVNIKLFESTKKTVNNKLLIMVARFAPAKDQATIIRALPFLNKEVRIRFVGDGETRSDCEKLANELGVSDRIDFMGMQTDIPTLIAESYIGIQSSNWEGFGLTAVEMMACGKPVIATDVDGLKQVVEGAGLLFSVGDEKELAKHINNLLNDEKYYNHIAVECKKRSALYDISTMAKKYLNLYHSLSNEN